MYSSANYSRTFNLQTEVMSLVQGLEELTTDEVCLPHAGDAPRETLTARLRHRVPLLACVRLAGEADSEGRVDGVRPQSGDRLLRLDAGGIVTAGDPAGAPPWWGEDAAGTLVAVLEGETQAGALYLLHQGRVSRLLGGGGGGPACVLRTEPLPPLDPAAALVGPDSAAGRPCTRYLSAGPGLELSLVDGGRGLRLQLAALQPRRSVWVAPEDVVAADGPLRVDPAFPVLTPAAAAASAAPALVYAALAAVGGGAQLRVRDLPPSPAPYDLEVTVVLGPGPARPALRLEVRVSWAATTADGHPLADGPVVVHRGSVTLPTLAAAATGAQRPVGLRVDWEGGARPQAPVDAGPAMDVVHLGLAAAAAVPVAFGVLGLRFSWTQ